MQQVLDSSTITEVFAVADTRITANELRSYYQGVVVEVMAANVYGDAYDGTLVYFPGVKLKDLKADTEVS